MAVFRLVAVPRVRAVARLAGAVAPANNHASCSRLRHLNRSHLLRSTERRVVVGERLELLQPPGSSSSVE